jgi:hypothetical protein
LPETLAEYTTYWIYLGVDEIVVDLHDGSSHTFLF